MDRPQGKDDDPFIGVAIPFILSVVLGFTLILLGFILLALAGLSLATDANTVPGWVWLLLGISAEGSGAFLMYRALKGTPPPGTFGPGGDT